MRRHRVVEWGESWTAPESAPQYRARQEAASSAHTNHSLTVAVRTSHCHLSQISMPHHADAVVHVGQKHGVDVLAGADGAVVDGLLSTETAEFVQVCVHRG